MNLSSIASQIDWEYHPQPNMPYSMVATNTLLTVIVTGRVSDDEFRRCVQDVRAVIKEAPHLDELVDLRAVTTFDVEPDTLRQAAAHPLPFTPQSRQAAVVSSEIGFGLSRMYEMLVSAERPNVRVFRNMNEALAWLSRSEGAI